MKNNASPKPSPSVAQNIESFEPQSVEGKQLKVELLQAIATATASPAGTPRCDAAEYLLRNVPPIVAVSKLFELACQLETELHTSATALSQAQRENAELREWVKEAPHTRKPATTEARP